MFLKPAASTLHIVLLVLVFIAGIATMSLEFAASRLLTPVFGSSIYTWGSLIGVVLVGLSIGYHVGGRLADKNPDFEKFCSILFSSGLYIVFIPFISSSVIDFTSTIMLDMPSDNDGNNLNSLVATFILLAIPTFLLGMISPYAIKLATKTLDRLGNISGNLYSVATIGSIAGTFVTVFVLIPVFEINHIMYGLGVLLISSSLVGLRIIPKILVFSIIIVLSYSLVFDDNQIISLDFHNVHFYPGKLIHEAETLYSHLDVIDNYNSINNRALFLNGYLHSEMNKDNPNDLVVDYTKFFPLGMVLNNDAKKVLFIGGGGFSGPKYFLQSYPNISVDVVEIDPAVVEVAKEYFSLDDTNPNLRIFTQDGREFLANHQEKYDLIILDAFSKSYVPFHLMTIEFYNILYNKLNPNGVIISNHIGSPNSNQDTSNLYRANLKTMLDVFPIVYVFPTDYSKSVQNIILATIKSENNGQGSNSPNRLEKEELVQLQENSTLIIDVNYADYLLDSSKVKTDDVPLLTDQYAPVESLLNPLSSKPYSIEEQDNSNTPINEKETGIDSFKITFSFPIAFMAIMLIIWGFSLNFIWKNKNAPKQ
ncbi:MAG: fused MFS/spermidine synthase [Thermoproteota archaeon]|nr:fused MFS/spermidine synthase [Thermoproteota archaeon]